MGILEQALENKRTAVILGHVNPDGDCMVPVWAYIII